MTRALIGGAAVWAMALAAADTGLYLPGAPDVVDPRNRPFSPQYPLWTDGLSKQRWVFLPPASTIDGRNEHDWVLPMGTKLWKQFSLDGRKVDGLPASSKWRPGDGIRFRRGLTARRVMERSRQGRPGSMRCSSRPIAIRMRFTVSR